MADKFRDFSTGLTSPGAELDLMTVADGDFTPEGGCRFFILTEAGDVKLTMIDRFDSFGNPVPQSPIIVTCNKGVQWYRVKTFHQADTTVTTINVFR